MNYFYAISTLSGTIIGAGLFAIPIIINKSGVIPFIFFLITLTIVQYFLHLKYAEVILSTRQSHRIGGYVGVYFNKKFKKITVLITVIGRHGALLAYIVLGGNFLHALLSPTLGGGLLIYTMALFLFESLIVLFGIKTIAPIELTINISLIFIILLITYKNSFYFNSENLTIINWKNMLLPYGSIFFALNGQSAIVEVCRLLDREKQKIKSAIAIGTVIPAILTLIFVISVIGVTGNMTTSNTIDGLQIFLTSKVIILTLALGLLAISSSYIMISQSLKEIYWWDLKINNKLSWFMASVVPISLYLIGFNNLQNIVSLTGTITGGMFGIILIILLFKVKEKRQQESIINTNTNKYAGVFISSLFIFGLIYGIFNFINI